jgi:hypothetical protein
MARDVLTPAIIDPSVDKVSNTRPFLLNWDLVPWTHLVPSNTSLSYPTVPFELVNRNPQIPDPLL